jgi:hypothetical protein
MRKILYTVIIFFLMLNVAYAKTLYVDAATGSDATTYANNAVDAKWATIGRAVWGQATRPVSYPGDNQAQAAQAGDIVLITAGTYSVPGTGSRNEPAMLPVNSGTSGNLMTFRAVGVVEIRTSDGVRGSLIGAYGASLGSYTMWDGFYFDETYALYSADSGVITVWNATGVQIINCEINGVIAYVADNHNGIRVEGSNTITLKNNKIYGVRAQVGNEYHWNGAAFMLYGNNGVVIENNEIYNCGSGIFVKGSNNANVIARKNYVYDSGYGLRTSYTHPTTGTVRFYQNIVRDCIAGGTGIVAGEYSINVYAVNNTIHNCSNGMYFNTGTGSSGYTFQNNIVSISTEAVNAGNLATGFFTNDYNDYFTATQWTLNSTVYGTIANWRTALGGVGAGNENNSIISDPTFTNATTHDFHLQAGSAALTLGIDILDLDGDTATNDVIPAGAYITGSEIIGLGDDDGSPEDVVAPTITNVSSDKANGSYTVGEVIDIDVTFSENVTSTGNVTVTLETGATDRTCTFTVTNSSTGTCNYTVQAGDTSGDLEATISGTIADQAANALTNYTPATNLAANKALIIDTTAPTVDAFTVPATSATRLVTSSTFTCTGATGYIMNESAVAPLASADGWTGTAPTSYTFPSDGNKTLYGWCKDLAGNVSTSVSDTVVVTTSGGDVMSFPCIIQ